MQQSTINLKHYVSVLTHLAFLSAQIAKECAQNPHLKKYEKSLNDPVTQADFKIQTLIIRTLNLFFPELKIIGEETTEYKGEIKIDYTQIDLDNYPQDSHLQQSVPCEELCVWIDPIDNTRGFIEGKLEKVTTLVGLARNNQAYLGVVVTPYTIEKKSRIFRPRVNIGYVPMKQTYVSYEPKKWDPIARPKLNKPLRMTTSGRNKAHIFHSIVRKYQAQACITGGAGHKFNLVIFGEADAVIYLGYCNQKWDSCANEAIIRSMGGFFSDENGKQIVYDPHNGMLGNTDGNICSLDEKLFHQLIAEITLYKGKGK